MSSACDHAYDGVNERRRGYLFPSYAKKLENNKLDVEQKLLLTRSNLVVDLGKCTGCGVCIDACPEEAVSVGPVGAVGRGKAQTSKIDVDAKKCSYCGVCNVMCPFDAVKLTVDGQPKLPILEQQGFPQLERNASIDKEKCTNCVLCEEVCPRDAIKREVVDVDQGHKAASTNTRYVLEYKLDEEKCTLCGICSELCDAYKIDFKEPTPLTVKKIGKLSFDEKKCDFCQLCITACPEEAVKLERKELAAPKLSGKVDISLPECITCSWCQVICPREAVKVDKVFEGEYELVTEKCPAGCSTCVEVCPANALYIPPVEEAGQKPGKLMFNKDFCMYCGACVTACPVDGTIKMRRTKINWKGEETILSKKIADKLMAEKTPRIRGA